MARPRKDAAEPGARERLVEAFWQLLEESSVADISVGAVTRAAGCNRGTFYYHFADIEELQKTAIGQMFLEDGVLVCGIWRASLGRDVDGLLAGDGSECLHRLVLALKSGAAPLVNTMAREMALERWTEAACPEGGELAPDARFAIQFMLSGVLSLAAAVGFSYEDASSLPKIEIGPHARSYLRSAAAATVDTVAEAQGIDRGDLAARLVAKLCGEPDAVQCGDGDGACDGGSVA